MYRIAYSHTAMKSRRRLPANWRRRVTQKIEEVAENPHGEHAQVKRLTGRTTFRLRVGDWRVFYDLNDETETMTVLDILKRDEAYR